MIEVDPFTYRPCFKRRVDPVDAKLDLCNDIAITACFSERFKTYRTIGKRTSSAEGAVGQVFIYAPGELVRVSAEGICSIIQVRLRLERLRAVALEDHGIDADFSDIASHDGGTDLVLSGLLCQAVQHPASSEESERIVVARLLARAGWGKPTSSIRGGIAPARLRRVTDLVEARLDNVTLGTMAAEAAMSPFHFARSFKTTTGRAPWSYVVERRIARAVVLLADPELPLSDVAQRTGFASASHLVATVRKRLLITPDRLRRLMVGSATRSDRSM